MPLTLLVAFIVWVFCIALCVWVFGGIGVIIGHISGTAGGGFIGYYSAKAYHA